MGILEKCRECRGSKLEKKTAGKEEPQMTKEGKVPPGFCPEHPEEDTVVFGPGRRPKGGAVQGKCKSCEAEKKTKGKQGPEIPESEVQPFQIDIDKTIIPLCKVCGKEPAKIDSLGRNMGACRKCLAIRNRDQLALGSKSGYAPFYIPLNDPRFAEIKQWLEGEAEEAVRELPQEVMYRLKLAHREAMVHE